MNFTKKLEQSWRKSNSLLCIGLDPDFGKVPSHIRCNRNPFFEFNRRIIDKTHDLVCAYKPQIAYYSANSMEKDLELTISYIKNNFPHIVVILDAKRSDIDSTAEAYARESFVRYGADSVTVNPYMGYDSVRPFCEYKNNGVIVLCKTSNPSSKEFQDLKIDGVKLYKLVSELASKKWNYNKNIALVIGSTFPKELGEIRKRCPMIPFLVPGIGTQGGDLKRTLKYGLTKDKTGLIISSSRSIIYASNKKGFESDSRNAALLLKNQINDYRFQK